MRFLLLAAVLFATAASAHFRLISPADWLIVDGIGDPDGGDQKAGPCGHGQTSGVVTTLTAGQQLDVQWEETVMHPGWYRIALAENRADFPPETAALNCTSGDIMSP